MKKILWIEDETDNGMIDFRVWLEDNDEFELTIARNATQGLQYLRKEVFNAIVVDIRIFPGSDPFFNKVYYQRNKNGKAYEKLGIALIAKIFDENSDILGDNKIAKKVGVFSIEPQSDFKSLLEEWELTNIFIADNYLYKTKAEMPVELEKFILNKLLN